MQKILAFLMSIFMMMSTLLPLTPSNLTIDEWSTTVCEELGIIGEGTPFQILNSWKFILPEDKVIETTPLTWKEASLILNRASNGLYLVSPKWGRINKYDAAAALNVTKELMNKQVFGTPAIVTQTDDELSFAGTFSPILQTAEIKTANQILQTSLIPLDSEEGITQSNLDYAALLEKLDVDFSIGDFDFNLKVTDTGFNLGIGAVVCNGVNISKQFEISQLEISTKFDGNLATKDIREAYLRADYELKDVTRLTGSYAASVGVNPAEMPEGTPIDFMNAAKAGALELMPGGGNKITVFSFEVPIPNCPAITVSLDINLRISVDGKIEIIITSHNVKGIEIVDNRVRVINEIQYGQQTYDIMANVQFTVGLCLGVKVLGYCVIDVEVEAGVGVNINAYIVTDTAVYILEIPLDLAIEIPYPTNSMDNAQFCGNATIYGILKISIGQNSPLLKTLGLTKTWVIFDKANGVIYNLHIEETGVVPECTRARTS